MCVCVFARERERASRVSVQDSARKAIVFLWVRQPPKQQGKEFGNGNRTSIRKAEAPVLHSAAEHHHAQGAPHDRVVFLQVARAGLTLSTKQQKEEEEEENEDTTNIPVGFLRKGTRHRELKKERP